MDAILLAPPEAKYVRGFATHEYLGLGYLATYLEKLGFNVELYNCNCPTAPSLDQVVCRITDAAPPVVGISIPTMPNLPGGVHAIQKIRRAGFQGHITVGGHVPTFEYGELLRIVPGLDSVVCGEGEETLAELVRACSSGKDWTTAQGLAYRRGDQAVCNAPRPLISNIDQLPFPRRALGEIPEKRTSRIAEIASSRGCYGNCTFCSVFGFYDASPGPRFRYRSPENVVAEAKQLVETQHARTIMFVDDNFLGSGKLGKQRAVAIGRLMHDFVPDASFSICCRANDVDPPTFSELKRCGLNRVFLGIESGVDSVLKRFRKHVTVAQNLQAIRTLNGLGIKWDMGFIIYDPDTTFDELETNVEFLRRNRLYQFNAATQLLNGMVVFPGTPLEAQLRAENRLERHVQDALRFATAEETPADYDTALRFVNYVFKLRDPKAELMRRMIDYAYENLGPVYDVIWPLVSDWERWIESAAAATHCANADRLLQSLGDVASTYRTLLHWTRSMGSLVMNLLEDMVGLVKEGQTMDAFQRIFENRVLAYVYKGHQGGISMVVPRAEEFLGRESVAFGLDGREWTLPGLGSRLTYTRDHVAPTPVSARTVSEVSAYS